MSLTGRPGRVVVHLITVSLVLGPTSARSQLPTPPPTRPALELPTELSHTLLEASGVSHGMSSLALERVRQVGLARATEGASESSCGRLDGPAELARLGGGNGAAGSDVRVACLIWRADQRYRALGERVRGGAFLPVGDHFEAVSFWKEGGVHPEVLRSGSLFLEDRIIQTDLEILSDLIGAVRVGLGVSVASERGSEPDSTEAGVPADPPADDSDLGALSRLANAGGTVYLSGAFPVFYRAPSDRRSILSAMLVGRFATESPELGGYLENPALSGSVGLDLTYYRPGFEELIDIELGALVRGYAFNRAFRQKLEATDESAGLVALRAGIVIARRTMLSLTWRIRATELFDEQSELVVALQTVRR